MTLNSANEVFSHAAIGFCHLVNKWISNVYNVL